MQLWCNFYKWIQNFMKLHIPIITLFLTSGFKEIVRAVMFRDRMVVGFTTTWAFSAYHHLSCEFNSRSWWGIIDTTLCDKVCQWLAVCWWFSPGTPVSLGYSNKTDRHDITEILLKVALNTITLTLKKL